MTKPDEVIGARGSGQNIGGPSPLGARLRLGLLFGVSLAKGDGHLVGGPAHLTGPRPGAEDRSAKGMYYGSTSVRYVRTYVRMYLALDTQVLRRARPDPRRAVTSKGSVGCSSPRLEGQALRPYTDNSSSLPQLCKIFPTYPPFPGIYPIDRHARCATTSCVPTTCLVFALHSKYSTYQLPADDYP